MIVLAELQVIAHDHLGQEVQIWIQLVLSGLSTALHCRE